MVGRRPRLGGSTASSNSNTPRRRDHAFHYRDDDEEATIAADSPSHNDHGHKRDGRSRSRPVGIREAAQLVFAERRRQDLKRKILDGMHGFSLEGYRKSDDALKAIQSKKLRAFYEAQNARLDDWLEVDALVYALADDVIDSMNPDADRDGVAERSGPLQHARGSVEDFLPPEHREKRARDEKRARWAIYVNVVANVLMLAAKLISLKFSPSLSLAASTADSALDLFCTLIIYGTNRVVAWRLDSLKMKYPVGRRRLEPIGILVFSVIMVVSFLQILQESVSKLLPGGDRDVAELPPVAIGAMAANAIVKGLIGLACMPIKTTQVQALVQDCKTDVYFNLASLLFPLTGVVANVWWLDPVGAAFLALYVVVDWSDTCLQNVSRLTGLSVDESIQQKLMFLAWRFSPVVAGYKTLTAYHTGDGVWVELDILFDEKTSLVTAHDIAETLQYCFEGMQEVDRAFVTVDYSSLGPLGHVEE